MPTIRFPLGGIRGSTDDLVKLDQITEWLGAMWGGKPNRSEALRQAISMMYALAEPETWQAFLAFMSATGELDPQEALKGAIHHALSEAVRNKAMIEKWCAEHPEEE